MSTPSRRLGARSLSSSTIFSISPRSKPARSSFGSRSFALAPLVEGVVELLAPRAEAKNLEIASFIAAECRRNASMATRRACARCSSISPATPSISPRRAASACAWRSTREGALVFRVVDTGPGVAARRARDHLRGVRARRRLVHPPPRRHRPRPRHLAPSRQADGRPPRDRGPHRVRLGVRFHPAARTERRL